MKKDSNDGEKRTSSPDMEIINLVENIDTTARRAGKMELTKIAFIDCLRQVN